ncbi:MULTISPECIES: hypothetical protein [Kordiimonas]|jgi:hypothetical protein|uniref:Uncharacterized protein n=1 Tax=Kordiimonas lacus TaxID=637679 RepID=A0A1G6UJK3_9PROT|nr:MULTISPECIES: hypothetical protein [Kordiimonas]SDD40896.1 hypothetical protein SAMN04488071_0596 [Kordiimonas lacus]
MELFLRAQSPADFDRTSDTDVFACAKKQSPLVKWTFINRIKSCHQNGELGATLMLLACGSVLAGLLAVANMADRAAGLFRS